MVKLSDALRGAADRAPLDGVTVSTHSASRRVSVNRGLRGTATGLVGATAVGVIALGVIGPNGLNATEDAQDTPLSVAEAAPSVPDRGSANDALTDGGAASSQLAVGLCGQQLAIPDVAYDWPVSLEVETPGEIDPGSTLPVEVQATIVKHADAAAGGSDSGGSEPADTRRQVTTTGPDAYVTWDNIVVASVPAESLLSYGPADQQVLNPDADTTTFAGQPGYSQEFAVDVPLVNCWDGTELPAGEYGLTVRQGFFESAVGATPTLEASPEPLPSGPPASTSGVAPSADTAPGEPTPPIEELPSALPAGTYSEVYVATEFTIAGDPVKDPFAEYLRPTQPPVEPPSPGPLPEPPAPLPDGTLTPDIARQLYQDGLTDTRWDMAAGTQRWLVSNDSAQANDDGAWANSYFGCGMDQETDGRFPTDSATMDLLDVSGDFPASIGVSYGWVVDGNPVFSLTARNVSDYTIGGFAPTLNSQLYLVKDGKVVAEAWGVSPDQNRGVVMYGQEGLAVPNAAELEDLQTMSAQNPSIQAYQAPVLAPGESVGSTFLWRDIQGCWTADGQADVAPGVYTLVSSQYVPVGSSQIHSVPDSGIVESGSAGSGEDVLVPEPRGALPFDDDLDAPDLTMEPQPVPTQYDAVSFQLWTSFGAITVD